MTVTQKILANGQLPSSIGDLYECPANYQAKVQNIRATNTDSVARTVNIYILPSGGTARRIWPKDLSLTQGDTAVDDSAFTLDQGDKVQGDASAASVVDYTIYGMERV